MKIPRQGEVHIWWTVAKETVDIDVLSDDERLRAARFRFPVDRRRFTHARAMLRQLLSKYLGASPASHHLSYGRFGKPELPESNLTFNLSHAGPFTAIAIGFRQSVGIDIELVSQVLEWKQIRNGRFGTGGGVDSFLQEWTRAEALRKATGEGIAAGRIDRPTPDWTTQDVSLLPDVVCAVAGQGAMRIVHMAELRVPCESRCLASS